MIHFAIIGCGRIASRHIDSLRGIPGVTVAAVVDTDPKRAAAAAATCGAKAFHSIRELLDWGHFDVACVCTPSGLHAEHSVELLQAGMHVVVEKPMALRISDAELMVHTAKENNVQLFVVKQNRFNLPVLALKRALDAGRFGRLVMGTVRVRWCRNQDYYDQADWRGRWASDGGVFSNQASHHVDLLHWCMGDVESVQSKTARRLADIECEDTGVTILKFRSGALGVIEATTATRPKDLEGSLSVLGEKGTVEIGGFAVNQMRHFQFSPCLPEDAQLAAEFSENPPNVYGFGHKAFLSNVASCLRGEGPALVCGAEGLKSLRLIHAIYASAEQGREVFLSDNPVSSLLGQNRKIFRSAERITASNIQARI